MYGDMILNIHKADGLCKENYCFLTVFTNVASTFKYIIAVKKNKNYNFIPSLYNIDSSKYGYTILFSSGKWALGI